MTVELEHAQRVCWRCGGTGKINHDTDRCPGCAGTGQQAYQRPRCAAQDPFSALAEVELRAKPQGDAGYLVYLMDAYLPPTADQPCPSCGGSGYRVYQREVADGSGRIETVTEPCSGCGGRGRVG